MDDQRGREALKNSAEVTCAAHADAVGVTLSNFMDR